ncbi:MAG: YciI family protein [Gemmatimonadaceae bacterium]
METAPSTYMLIFRESTPERYEEMSPEQLRRSLDDWNDWCDSLTAQGRLQHGSPLEPDVRLVSGAHARGAADGPFAEAKELIGGYFLLTAASMDEAVAIAGQSPNLRYGMTIEVRQLSPRCHLARALGLATMRPSAGA